MALLFSTKPHSRVNRRLKAFSGTQGLLTTHDFFWHSWLVDCLQLVWMLCKPRLTRSNQWIPHGWAKALILSFSQIAFSNYHDSTYGHQHKFILAHEAFTGIRWPPLYKSNLNVRGAMQILHILILIPVHTDFQHYKICKAVHPLSYSGDQLLV